MVKKNSKVLLLGVGVIFVVLGISVGLKFFSTTAPKKDLQSNQIETDIPVVQTMVVRTTGGDSEGYSYSGEVRGRYESQLAFQTGGKITQQAVQLGSVVKQGQILAKLDPVDIQQGVNIAKAQVASVQSQFQLAKDNYERFQKLFAREAVSQAELDNARNGYQTAAAALSQVKTQYANATHQSDYCNLYANALGVVTAIYAEIGQIVGPGQPIVTIVRDGEKEVEINVPENRLDEIRNAQELQAKFWALPNLSVAARVREVAPMADAVSHTYKVRVGLTNPPAELKLGMTASVSLKGAAGDQATIYLPLTAIYQTGDNPEVWIYRNGTVHLRPVTVGEFGDDQVQVLSGLQEGDVVVTAGVHLLQESQKVRRGDQF